MPYSTANGVKIYYETAGEGPALVFIHSNPFDHNLWIYQSAHFSTWFKIISVDIRGYGRSENVTASFTVSDMCDDVIGVMDDEGVDQAIVCGNSIGSRMTMLLGMDHPDRFRGLIVVGGNSGLSPRYQKRVDGYTKKGVPAYRDEFMKELVAPEFSDTRIGKYLFEIFTKRNSWLSAEALAQTIIGGNNTIDITPRLSEIKMPTLVINGEYDHSMDVGPTTAKLIPGAVHKVLPGTGHACPIEDPAGFDTLVIEFLEANGLMPAL